MSNLRTSIILNMTGNLGNQSRAAGRDLHNMGQRGARAISLMNRGLSGLGRGLDALGNRYTAFITGAGAAGAVRMVANLERRMTRLGIQAGKSADEMERLKNAVYAASRDQGTLIDPGELLGAVEEITEKTGDLNFATENLKNFAAAIQATGAEGKSIGGIAAEFQKMGIVEPKKVLEALDILTVQGKEGAFTLQNLADLGPRVVTAYTSMGRTGVPAIREMGAALQVIRQGTGSSEMAATAFEALIRTFGDANKIKLLGKQGIQIFDPAALKKGQEVLRPINELMAEIIQKTNGRKSIMSQIFDAEAIRAFNAGISEYQRTGSVLSLKKFFSVQADGKTILADSARAAKDFQSAMTYLTTSFQVFADRELTEPIKAVAGYLNSLEPGTVDRWMKMAKWIAILGGGAVAARGVFRFFAGFGGRGLAGIPGMGGGVGTSAGVVPVFVTNMGGFQSPGGAIKGAGMSAMMMGGASAGLLAIGTGIAYTVVKGIEQGFKEVGTRQIKGWSNDQLGEQLRRVQVMGDANGTTAKMIISEMERRTTYPKWMKNITREQLEAARGEVKIKIDSAAPVRVTGMKASGMDLTVDTGRTMKGF